MSAAGLISSPRGRDPGPEMLTQDQRAKAYPIHRQPIPIAGRLYRAEGVEWDPEPQPQPQEEVSPCSSPSS